MEEKSINLLVIDVLQILKDNGVNINRILMNGINNKKIIKLNEIKQININIHQVIKDYNLPPYYKISYSMQMLIKMYNGESEKSKISEEDKKRVEKLGLYTRNKSKVEIGTELFELLRDNGIDIKAIIKSSSLSKAILLKDIKQDGIDIMSIIEEYDLNPDIDIKDVRDFLLKSYYDDCSLSYIEEDRIEDLGIVQATTKKKPLIRQTLKTLEILKRNGVDVKKIKMQINENGVRRSSMLKDINQPGIDIMNIIEQYGLNPEENIGIKIALINQRYKGTAKGPITNKERKKAEELGIIRGKLREKEKEQQELQSKLDEVQQLRDDAKMAINKNDISK